jgi:hypothetical protein
LIVIYDPTAANYVMNSLQAASYLGVPKDLIDDLVAKRSIPFTKVGDLQDDLPNLGFQGRKVV